MIYFLHSLLQEINRYKILTICLCYIADFIISKVSINKITGSTLRTSKINKKLKPEKVLFMHKNTRTQQIPWFNIELG